MSRTDKTRPYWVQLTDNTFRVIEYHIHEGKPCDLDTYDPRLYETRYTGNWRSKPEQRCHLTIPYSGGAWPKRRHNNWAKEEMRQSEGRLRTLWRSKHRPGLLVDPDGYEGDIRPRHRHQVLWDMW